MRITQLSLVVGGVAIVAMVATIALVSAGPRRMALEEINADAGTLPETGEVVERPHESTEMIYAQQHPVYTRCAKRVDMPEFVKTIRKTCGNIHELSSLAAPCHNTLAEKAKEFGCCWETVMDAYSQLDPQAHHSWRMWQGTLSGKAGITFDDSSCGDAMGEHDYKKLEGEVDGLKDTVASQASELQLVENILLMSMGYFKSGAQSLKAMNGVVPEHLRVAHAPFSAGDLNEALKQLKEHHNAHSERKQMTARHAAHIKHSWHQMAKAGTPPTSFFFQNPRGDEGVRKMRAAGINI